MGQIRVRRPAISTAELAALDEGGFEYDEGDSTPTLQIVMSVDGDAASRLAWIAAALGLTSADVVAGLLRGVDRSAS
jgi:hypothetical protein